MIAYPLAIATALPIASLSLDPRYHFARDRDRDRDRDREVLKTLHRVVLGLWLGVVVDLVKHHHSVTREQMMDAAR